MSQAGFSCSLPTSPTSRPPLIKAKWTVDDKAYLRQAASEALPLKVMARALGRTATAVNKALCRFGLRPPEKINRAKAQTASSGRTNTSPRRQRSRSQASLNRARQVAPKFFWITHEGWLDWLAEHGCHVRILRPSSSGSPTLYRVSGSLMGMALPRHLSASQLLLRVNEWRRHHRLPVFYVSNLTEE